MASFSTTVLSALCLSVLMTLTFGQDPSDLSNPVYLLNNPDALSAEALCPSQCATGCQILKMSCTDIPDLLDCEGVDSQCTSQCSEMCGCLSDCATKCADNYPCSSHPEESIGQIGCFSQRLICKGTCQLTCPATMFIKGMSSSVQMTIAQVNQLLGNMNGPSKRR